MENGSDNFKDRLWVFRGDEKDDVANKEGSSPSSISGLFSLVGCSILLLLCSISFFFFTGALYYIYLLFGG